MSAKTKAACEALFALMAIEAVPYRRQPAIASQTARPTWMSSYAAMFAQSERLDQITDTEDAA